MEFYSTKTFLILSPFVNIVSAGKCFLHDLDHKKFKYVHVAMVKINRVLILNDEDGFLEGRTNLKQGFYNIVLQ